MSANLESAQEDFSVLVSELNQFTPGLILYVESQGDFYYSKKEDLYWFRHVIFYRGCSMECQGHQYWGTHVRHLKQFDSEEDGPDSMLGYRVVKNLSEAIDGSWADGGKQ